MQSIGFVGLGVMGGPMASNLVGTGFRVTGHDLRREAVDQLLNQGGGAAERLEDLVDCDAVIDAPLLQNSIRSLEEQGAEGLRSNLTAVIEALRASSGGTA